MLDYINWINKRKEFVIYIFFGGLTTLVNYVSYFTLTRYFQVDFYLSNVFSWGIAVLFAYITNKIFVFGSKINRFILILIEFLKFLSSRVLSGIIDTALLYFFVEFLNINDMIMKVINGVIVVILNYILSKVWVFHKRVIK